MASGVMEPIGRTKWAIAEGFIPGQSHGPAPEMTSHEACCILIASEGDAHVAITIFFEDRDPVVTADVYARRVFPQIRAAPSDSKTRTKSARARPLPS